MIQFRRGREPGRRCGCRPVTKSNARVESKRTGVTDVDGEPSLRSPPPWESMVRFGEIEGRTDGAVAAGDNFQRERWVRANRCYGSCPRWLTVHPMSINDGALPHAHGSATWCAVAPVRAERRGSRARVRAELRKVAELQPGREPAAGPTSIRGVQRQTGTAKAETTMRWALPRDVTPHAALRRVTALSGLDSTIPPPHARHLMTSSLRSML